MMNGPIARPIAFGVVSTHGKAVVRLKTYCYTESERIGQCEILRIGDHVEHDSVQQTCLISLIPQVARDGKKVDG